MTNYSRFSETEKVMLGIMGTRYTKGIDATEKLFANKKDIVLQDGLNTITISSLTANGSPLVARYPEPFTEEDFAEFNQYIENVFRKILIQAIPALSDKLSHKKYDPLKVREQLVWQELKTFKQECRCGGKAQEAASEMFLEVQKSFLEDYVKAGDIDKFETTSKKAMDNARPALENHFSLKKALVNLGLAIAGLIVGYLAVRAVNKLVYKGTFFIPLESDPINKITAMENKLKVMIRK